MTFSIIGLIVTLKITTLKQRMFCLLNVFMLSFEFFIVMLNVMLNVIMQLWLCCAVMSVAFSCCCVDCHHTECHCAESCNAEHLSECRILLLLC